MDLSILSSPQYTMSQQKGFRDDDPQTHSEYNEKDTLTDSDVKTPHDSLGKARDDWETATLVSDQYDEKSFMAEPICDSSPSTRPGSGRSAQKTWQPPGLKAGPSQPTVGFIEVDHHRPDIYPESCHPGELKEWYMRKLEKMRAKLPPSAPPYQSGEHDHTSLVVYRPPHATVESQDDSWNKWVARTDIWHTLRPRPPLASCTDDPKPSSYREFMRQPNHAEVETQCQSGKKGVARPILWSLSDLDTSSGSRDPVDPHVQAAPADSFVFLEQIEDEHLKSWAGLPDHVMVERDPKAPSSLW